MKFFATTVLQSNSMTAYDFTIVLRISSKKIVKSVETLEQTGASPRPYQLLDFISEVLPQKLYVDETISVEYGENPVLHPVPGYSGHPCLIVREGEQEKRYRLNHVVPASWLQFIPGKYLRAMVSWWRCHREEISYSPQQWNVWAQEL